MDSEPMVRVQHILVHNYIIMWCVVKSHHVGKPERVQCMLALGAWGGALHRAAAGCITQVSTTGKASKLRKKYVHIIMHEYISNNLYTWRSVQQAMHL